MPALVSPAGPSGLREEGGDRLTGVSPAEGARLRGAAVMGTPTHHEGSLERDILNLPGVPGAGPRGLVTYTL